MAPTKPDAKSGGKPAAKAAAKPSSAKSAAKPASAKPAAKKPAPKAAGVKKAGPAKTPGAKPKGLKPRPKVGARKYRPGLRRPGMRRIRSAAPKAGIYVTRQDGQRYLIGVRKTRPVKSGKTREARILKRLGGKCLAKLRIVKNGKVVKRLKPRMHKIGRPRNYDLGNGVYRFSRSRMYHKKAKYKFIKRKHLKALKPIKPTSIVKPIGGDNNGGLRTVLLRKRRNYYATTDKINSHPSKKRFSEHKRYIRKTLHPGKVCILLAGRHKGKRVVLVKILESGLLLVTGPMRLNGCPLRRISQNYVIATRTKLDLNGMKLPKRLNDEYFKRCKPKRQKKEEGDIFATKKEKYKVSDKRKVDQKAVDKEIMKAIKKHPDKAMIVRYLLAMFGLKKTQYPHRLIF